MIEYIKGEIHEITPTNVVVEASNIGYSINVSLNTFSLINDKKTCKLYIHEVIREDAHVLFGFENKKEREVFRLLISVSGIGANTARMILSSMTAYEVEKSILQNEVETFNKIKGIGIKTAQRVIVDLKDKVGKSDTDNNIFATLNNTIKEESLSALVMLGFNKKESEKLVDKVLKEKSDMSVEELIKEVLKRL
ncbi:MAG TPA: Holliday junction branch migration protein RuvA [Bacteroidales bacterium]|nr:MAG: Holliday junction DNA helicase RuvA [Bacteroidetes bacterium GWF2_33_38]OFY76297.1 MAG: Holliday junction DNA helicase RuvA [Bacteroidetes bacterium RIFOXYA12_FULL_33_9]OFY85645.1 MAG: Holliday junction DNA helicase RuvA [Bacteroidetes bacterium RIFOXYA2_FULL_33_7]HBF88056.1 Holliday junction branch migration protein RuvA [Bacteroidales bacterium]